MRIIQRNKESKQGKKYAELTYEERLVLDTIIARSKTINIDIISNKLCITKSTYFNRMQKDNAFWSENDIIAILKLLELEKKDLEFYAQCPFIKNLARRKNIVCKKES